MEKFKRINKKETNLHGMKHTQNSSYKSSLKGSLIKKLAFCQISKKSTLIAALIGCCLLSFPKVSGKDHANGFNHKAHTKPKGGGVFGDSSNPPKKDPSCDLFYMIVSTIDGRVSALDLHKKGQTAWSIEADSKPLYSSSLASIKMVRNNKEMRLIPSLDGALYQFDGEKVEAIPMSAEILLSSTYRLSDDSMVVGRKDLKSFGVDVASGQVLFHCGSDGCHHQKNAGEEESVDGRKVVVVTRDTQVVRSVDIKTGQEKWNFSVGQHELRLPPTEKAQIDEHEFGEDEAKDRTDDIPVFSSFKQCPHEEKYAGDSDYENFLRLVVPEGRVVALDKTDSSSVNWEHKFDSPITKAWLYRNGNLQEMSLFDGRYVPTLTSFTVDDHENESLPKPLLYIGSHNKNPYIQASPQMTSVMRSFPNSKIGHVIHPKINVAWRPYLNTASARTPIFSGNWPDRQNVRRNPNNVGSKPTTSLAVWHEEYPFDTGFFLYPEFRDTRSPRKSYIKLIEDLRSKVPKADDEEDYSILDILLGALLIYWRETLAIIVITIATIVMVFKFFKLSITGGASSESSSLRTNSSETKSESQEFLVTNETASSLQFNTTEGSEYVSRFESDFDCLHCLGKGGFGVVFEAVNKVDDQHYAIKRIMLPRSDGAKEKVLREVKVHAKLEHPGIVRYFNAWVESPPIGWQEEKDKNFLPSDLSGTNFSPTPSLSVTPSQRHSPKNLKKTFPGTRVKTLKAAGLCETKRPTPGAAAEASLDPECTAESTSDSIVFASGGQDERNIHPAGGSGEFSIHSELADISEGSWSGLGDTQSSRRNIVSFGSDPFSSKGDSSGSDHTQSSVPFSNYTSDSSVAHSHRPPLTDNDMTGDSVVFESSSHNQSTGADSVVFAEPSPQSLIKHSNQVSPTRDEHAIDITLSSFDKEEEEEDKQKSCKLAKNFLYIQMQLYRKDTLKDWLSQNTLNRDRHSVLTIFDQIVSAVDYVHKQGLIHRDLKPSNIFLTEDGHIKVGDFGLVTAQTVHIDQGNEASTFCSDKHTAEVGTTMYMSPEQIANKPYDLKVDIFSMGLIFLELWIPFTTEMERKLTLHEAKKQNLPERFTRELPAESGLVRSMTSRDPERRPATGEILEHILFEDVINLRSDHHSRKRTVSEKSS